MAQVTADVLRDKFDFHWEIFDIFLSGKSAIDSNEGLPVHSRDDAERFLRSYGFELENPIEKAETFGNFHEAINFIRRYFLQPENPDGLRLEIPRRILELADIRDLFLMSNLRYPDQTADTAGLMLKSWACAILKMMHTVAHVDQDIRTSYFADIQQQIFDRFYKLIHRDGDGNLFLGEREDDPERVNLVAFETKPKKSRDSSLLKLLHKQENVAEDIFDRVGLRFVTHTRLDAVRVVKYLKDKMIVLAVNIKPSRSRNTLVDLDQFRTRLGELLEKVERGEIDEDSLTLQLEAAIQPPGAAKDNPHSSEHYRAIQFTSRQAIKLVNPLYDDLKELKQLARARGADEQSTETAELIKAIDRVDLKYLQKEIRFFYPYEIQIVDERSYEDNEKGRSAHSEYKRAQIQTAMKRVMGPLIDVAR